MKSYNQITELFPISPVDAQESLPKTIAKGKKLTYTARLTKELIQLICVLFTGENPDKLKKDQTPVNWKNQVQYDQDGNKLYGQDEAGAVTKELYRRWEPVQFNHNRKATTSHFKLLSNRFARTGYFSSLRKIVIGSNGELLDGQHSLLALWYLFNDYDVDHVDVSVEINNADDPTQLFRLFDQAARKRTLKDALTTLGIDGFEADLAGTLRFVTLMSTGKELNQSRLTLPHITDEKGKLVSLQPDDIASLMAEGQPFNYVTEDLLPLLSQDTTLTDESSGDESTVSLLDHPALVGPGMPNAQYWMAAYVNSKYDLRTEKDQVNLDVFTKFLHKVIKEDSNSAISKLRGFKPAKAIDWLPAIEHCFYCWLHKQEPKRAMPKTLTFNGVQAQYDSYKDSLDNNEVDDTAEEDPSEE